MRNKPANAMRQVVVLGLLTLAPLASAEESSPLPVTHGSIIRNSARITFEWPKPVKFTASARGNIVTISFARAANPDFGTVLSQLYPYITSAERKSDGRTIQLTLSKPYKIRTFLTDNISGIDILDINPAERLALTDDAISEETDAETLAALAPAGGKKEAPEGGGEGGGNDNAAAIKAAKAAAAAPPPVRSDAKPAESEVKPVERPEDWTQGSGVADNTAESPGKTSSTLIAPAVDNAAKSGGVVRVGLSAAPDSAILRFPFSERVASAVYTRGHTLYIVFNKPFNLNLDDFASLPQTVIGKPTMLPAGKVTIMRVPLDENVYASVAKEASSFEWAVLIVPKMRPLANALNVQVRTDPPSPPHVFVPALESADPVQITDPDVGDELVAVPLYGSGTGVPLRRDFVEFALLQSSQGVVIAKKADDVVVQQVLDGLRVTLPQGASLTPGLPEVPHAETQAAQLLNSATLFPYEQWKPENTNNFRPEVRKLFHRIVENSDIQDANLARLRMAQIYLSQGFATEALGLLDNINTLNSAYYRSAKLSAMHGTANFLLYRFSEAQKDFAASELNNNREVDYWRNVLNDLLGNPVSYDYLALNDDYISKYPPVFRQRLAIVAADRSINNKEYNVALKIFDTLHQDNLLDPINAYINFLLAQISAATGEQATANGIWDRLADDDQHPFVQARAEFSRIIYGLEHGDLDKKQGIDRLERLRMAWHGDNLELQVLRLLGDLYNDQKDYVSAMRIWDDGINSFANSAIAVEMSRKMSDTFNALFAEGAADSLSALDALALYYQYRSYSPSGPVQATIIERLADRLMSVDLLDQAAALLDHQMHFQSEKEARSRLGAKLAGVQLVNHQPKKALRALADSVYGDNEAQLRLQRNRLTAEAMMELGQSDRALLTLGNDDSPEAEHLRINIYWQEKDWKRVSSAVETMLKSRPDPAAPITLPESEYLLKLALSYVFEHDTLQLQYLHDYFGPLMADNPHKDLFEFVTAAEIDPTPSNFDEVMKYVSDTRHFVDSYQARIQTAGGDPATKAGSAPATAKPAETVTK